MSYLYCQNTECNTYLGSLGGTECSACGWKAQADTSDLQKNVAALESQLAEEAEAANNWRRLALQFDGHRMQALGYLKALLKGEKDLETGARTFIASPPLSGEQVLAERIAAMAKHATFSTEHATFADELATQGAQHANAFDVPTELQHWIERSTDDSGPQQARVMLAERLVVTEAMHVAAIKVLHRSAGVDGLPQRMLDAMLAAAPTPPAQERKPLTDEQIDAIWRSPISFGATGSAWRREIARKIERAAHGIGATNAD